MLTAVLHDYRRRGGLTPERRASPRHKSSSVMPKDQHQTKPLIATAWSGGCGDPRRIDSDSCPGPAMPRDMRVVATEVQAATHTVMPLQTTAPRDAEASGSRKWVRVLRFHFLFVMDMMFMCAPSEQLQHRKGNRQCDAVPVRPATSTGLVSRCTDSPA